MTSTSDFQTFWKNVASQFASNDLVIFDTSKSKPQATYLVREAVLREDQIMSIMIWTKRWF